MCHRRSGRKTGSFTVNMPAAVKRFWTISPATFSGSPLPTTAWNPSTAVSFDSAIAITRPTRSVMSRCRAWSSSADSSNTSFLAAVSKCVATDSSVLQTANNLTVFGNSSPRLGLVPIRLFLLPQTMIHHRFQGTVPVLSAASADSSLSRRCPHGGAVLHDATPISPRNSLPSWRCSRCTYPLVCLHKALPSFLRHYSVVLFPLRSTLVASPR